MVPLRKMMLRNWRMLCPLRKMMVPLVRLVWKKKAVHDFIPHAATERADQHQCRSGKLLLPYPRIVATQHCREQLRGACE